MISPYFPAVAILNVFHDHCANDNPNSHTLYPTKIVPKTFNSHVCDLLEHDFMLTAMFSFFTDHTAVGQL